MFTVAADLWAAAPGLALVAEDPDGGIITRDTVSPGGIGFILFVLLGIGTIVLWRSMNKQLKRIDFDDGAGPTDPGVEIRGSSAGGSSLGPGAEETPEH